MIIKKRRKDGVIQKYHVKAKRERLKGGYGDHKPDSAFNKAQLRKGIKVEMEHTNSPRIAKEIAKDHLTEHKDYYKSLEKMEERLRK